MFGKRPGRVGGVGLLTGARRGPSLQMDFTTFGGAGDSRLTVTRAAGGATYFDSSNVLQLASANTQRIDYGLTAGTSALGLLVEESRVNSIRNPRAEGAVVGTPGTLPTNWSVASIGLTQQIVGFGSSNGIPYVDIRVSGTTSGQFGQMLPEGNGIMAAVNAQVWTGSMYLALVAGTLTNVATVGLIHNYYNSGASFLGQPSPSPVTLTSTLTRFSYAATVNQASAAFINLAFYFTTSAGSGQAVDFTVRIGAPQLELGAFVTSPILPAVSSPAATTRAADVVKQTPIPWYNTALRGSFVVDYLVSHGAATVDEFAGDISTGATANRYALRTQAAGNQAAQSVTTTGSSSTTGTTLGNNTSGTAAKVGVAWSTGAQRASRSGGTVVATASGDPVGPLTQLNIGSTGAGTSPLNGWVRRVRYWPRTLSDTELQAATT